MKIAWFTPLAPRSAIGDYSEEIAGTLAAEDSITLFYPGTPEHGAPRALPVPAIPIPASPDRDFAASLEGYDIRIYNMGNYLDYHLPIYRTAVRTPGIVILHDVVMRDFFLDYFHRSGRGAVDYGRLLRKAHGPEADRVAADVLAGRTSESTAERLRHPLFRPVLTGALGVIVHSEYARRRVAAEVAAPVRAIDFPAFGPSRAYANAEPVREPSPDGKIRILSFGMINRNRLIPETIEAIAASEFLRSRCRFDLIGHGDRKSVDALTSLIRQSGLGAVVFLHGWQSEDELRAALLASEVVINLRNPHSGESSCVLATSLLAGVPTVVWNHGSYAEVPDSVAVKVDSIAGLGPALERLVGDRESLAAYGASARRYALETFSTGRYCRNFRTFVGEVRRGKPLQALADTVSGILSEMGPMSRDRELVERVGAIIDGFAPDRQIDPVQIPPARANV